MNVQRIYMKIRSNRSSFSRILNITIVVYAFLLPFSYAFSVFTGPLIMLVLWLLEGDLEKKFDKIYSNRAILFFFLFFCLHLFSLIWTNDYHAASRVIKFYFAITVVIVVLYTSLQKKYASTVLIAFLVSMFISEILLYGVLFEWWSFKKASVHNPSPIMHHIFYSIFLAVTTMLLLWQLFDREITWKIKLFELFFLTSTTLNLFLNGGRTGQLAFVLALFVFIISYLGFQRKYLLRTFAAITTLFVLAYLFSPIFNTRVHEGISDVKNIMQGNLNNSWGLRIAMKKIGLEVLAENPVLGVGVGDVLDDFHKCYENSNLKNLTFLARTTHVHDQFLQIALQTGIVGVGIFLLFLFYLFKTPFENPLTKAVFYAIVTIFLFSFFTDVPLRNFTAGLFGFVIGYMLRRADEEHNPHNCTTGIISS